MTVTRPAFADKLPPRDPTLAEMARAALVADAMAVALHHAPDAELAALDRRDAFFNALEAQTGITRDMLRELV